MSRLDFELAARSIVKSRNVAGQLIKDGVVFVNGRSVTKASFNVEETDDIEIKGELPRYVGRGGLKLEKAIECFNIGLGGCVCIDVGASTGGFTDCMLQNGAERVYAVDVGSNQLDEKLKSDIRVRDQKGSLCRKCARWGYSKNFYHSCWLPTIFGRYRNQSM